MSENYFDHIWYVERVVLVGKGGGGEGWKSRRNLRIDMQPEEYFVTSDK